MIAGVVAIAVMLPIALGRGQVEVSDSGIDRAGAATEAGASPTASPTAEADAEPPVIAVYGDSYSVGTGQGGTGPAGWPALVAGRLAACDEPADQNSPTPIPGSRRGG